jgi:hypothetical protein
MAPELQPSTSSDFAKGPLLPNVAADASASQRPIPFERVTTVPPWPSPTFLCHEQNVLYS